MPEVAERLAFRIKGIAQATDTSEVQVRRWIESGALKSFRIGRSVYVDAAELDRFLETHRSK